MPVSRLLLKDSNAKGKDAVYTVVSRGKHFGKAIRTKRWRYSKWVDGEELYALNNDIEEHRKLANSPEYASILEQMRRHLKRAEALAGEKAVTPL